MRRYIKIISNYILNSILSKKIEYSQVKSLMNTQYGAGDRTRTGTLSPAVDFESTTSTIPSHRQVLVQYSILFRKLQVLFSAVVSENALLFWCFRRRDRSEQSTTGALHLMGSNPSPLQMKTPTTGVVGVFMGKSNQAERNRSKRKQK